MFLENGIRLSGLPQNAQQMEQFLKEAHTKK